MGFARDSANVEFGQGFKIQSNIHHCWIQSWIQSQGFLLLSGNQSVEAILLVYSYSDWIKLNRPLNYNNGIIIVESRARPPVKPVFPILPTNLNKYFILSIIKLG